MVALIETSECFPKPKKLPGFPELPAPPADHEHCPRGHTTPGLIGGWLCPCPCHDKPVAQEGAR